jgi:hypothetical protein
VFKGGRGGCDAPDTIGWKIRDSGKQLNALSLCCVNVA